MLQLPTKIHANYQQDMLSYYQQYKVYCLVICRNIGMQITDTLLINVTQQKDLLDFISLIHN